MDIGLDGIVFGLQRFGGVGNYFSELAKGLAELDEIQPTLESPSRRIFQQYASVQAAFEGRTTTDRRPVPLARYLPSTLGTPILHSSYYRLPRSRRTKLVITVYDFVYERYVHGPRRWVHATQKSAACHRADAVICISENTRRDLFEFYPRIDRRKVHVVGLGVDRHTFRVAQSTSAAPDDVVLFVGRRDGYKRFDLAVAAVALAGLSLGVVGGPLNAAEEALLETTAPGRWRWLGNLDGPGIAAAYAAAYAFISPSDYEGFGLPILEAQASGCPVIASHRSSFPEVGGEGALYAEQQEAAAYAELLRSLGDTELRVRLTLAGLANVELFDWKKTVNETVEVYRQASCA